MLAADYRVKDAASERGYRLVGDVASDEVSEKTAAITACLAAWGRSHDRDADVQHGQSSSAIAVATCSARPSHTSTEPVATTSVKPIFVVSNFKIEGLICAARTKREPMRGDKPAARASRLIQSLPRYISAVRRAQIRGELLVDLCR